MIITSQISRYSTIDKTTITNEEMLVDNLFDPSYSPRPKVKKIQIAVDKDCEVTVNGLDTLKIKAKYGLVIDYTDEDVSSLIVKTEGVGFYAILGY